MTVFDQNILARHIDRASEPMVWGVDDCCQFVRAIVLEHGGPDIMDGIPAYASKEEADMLCDACGRRGFVRVVMGQAERFRAVCYPYPPDRRLVGLVASEAGPALAIMVRGHWIARSRVGVTVLPANAAVMAWEV